jgi:hypothetical protein
MTLLEMSNAREELFHSSKSYRSGNFMDQFERPDIVTSQPRPKYPKRVKPHCLPGNAVFIPCIVPLKWEFLT